MKFRLPIKSLSPVLIIVACCTVEASSDVLISDFETTNPLVSSYTGSTWASPVDQFQSFTDGSVSGQEVLPLEGGNPTVSGGAETLGLNLNLSGTIALELTARLLPDHGANVIQVLLLDADGTRERFNFSSSDFNTSTFSSAWVDFNDGITSTAGTTPGLDLTAITAYGIQGNYYDNGGSADAMFGVQLDNLNASVIPEPRSIIMISLTGISILIIRRQLII
ncbi:hypothetical protein [Pontiella agarivorans]|uniref:PEP-CTERM protein-sorting domain-containing protein n=1 Tax=Pontiella agarivorans TaxID=3038953 RepID=A0ABU5MSK7_9BACT|nr:hypothetical protein [Pontiella agarivorans]MDZ8117192.1 hypothetical protein [Pontiella agarivorans]